MSVEDSIPEEILYAWAAGALPPGRALEVEAAIRASARLQAKVALVLAELKAEETPAPVERWLLPPPGHPLGLAARALPVEAFSGEALEPGSRLRILLPEGVLLDGMVVLLWRGEGPYEVLWPRHSAEARRAADLPQDEEGRRFLDVVIRPAPRRQRYALAVAPPDLPVDWVAEPTRRWAPLRVALEEGRAQAGTVEIELSRE